MPERVGARDYNLGNDQELIGVMERADVAYQQHLGHLRNQVQRREMLYPMDRHLEGEKSYIKFLSAIHKRDEVGEILPETEDFIQVIDRLIEMRKGQAESKGIQYRPPVVMDVGPGNFQALLDARKKWGDDVILVGVGPDILLDFDGVERSTQKHIAPTRQQVDDAGITIIPESLVKIDKAVPETLKPDVILSCQALQYTDTPLWETFSKIYNKLPPGGYAFVAFGPPNISGTYNSMAETSEERASVRVTTAMNNRYKEDLERLETYLRNQGYEFDINSEKGQLSCKKLEVNGSYELPQEVRTIIRPTLTDLGLPENPSNKGAISGMLEKYPRYLSAFPIMNIPETSR
jgi:hypothetical protein